MQIGTFIPQHKGKDFSKVAKSKFVNDDQWYYGIKYDGNYCQIHKKGDAVIMFSSTGKPFVVEELAKILSIFNSDFIIEAEFLNNCSGLLLNDRTKCSTGTPRANYKKGKPTSMPNSHLKVFDILNYDGIDMREKEFKYRSVRLKYFYLGKFISNAIFMRGTFVEAQAYARDMIALGGEGVFAFHGSHTIKEKGRSNLAVKLKADNKTEMTCVDVRQSDTQPKEWGALVLMDVNGHEQSFGGLTDKLRNSFRRDLIGKTFKVRFENFVDGKYVQGFVCG